MSEISNHVLASLLVLFIVVSIVGTWSTLEYITSMPVQAPVEQPLPSGEVAIFVSETPEPISTGGMVKVYIS